VTPKILSTAEMEVFMSEWSMPEIIFVLLLLLLALGRYVKRQSRAIDIIFFVIILGAFVLRIHLTNQSHLLKKKLSSVKTELEETKENVAGLSVRGEGLVINVKDVASKHLQKANEFLDHEEFNKALKEFKSLLRLGESEAVHSNIGICYYKTGNSEEAKEHYQKALEINSAYHFAWNNLGVIYLEEWKLDEAEYNFSKALEIKPDFDMAKNNLSKVFNNKGAIYMKNYQLDKAREFFTKALQLIPDSKTARENLKKMDNLPSK